ncbi:MAG TPA: hypothetical protein VGP12_09570, partial [Nitrosospira sp.]|nr:hypothetical protein [Nitrosospira sp.]
QTGCTDCSVYKTLTVQPLLGYLSAIRTFATSDSAIVVSDSVEMMEVDSILDMPELFRTWRVRGFVEWTRGYR